MSQMAPMGGSMHAMLSAMAVMALPAFLICAGFTLMAYRRRDRSGGS